MLWSQAAGAQRLAILLTHRVVSVTSLSLDSISSSTKGG